MKTCDIYKNELSCLSCPYPAESLPCENKGGEINRQVTVKLSQKASDMLFFLTRRCGLSRAKVSRALIAYAMGQIRPEIQAEFKAFRAKEKHPAEVTTPQGAKQKIPPKEYLKGNGLSSPRSVVRRVIADGRLYMPRDMVKSLGVSKDDPVLITYDDGKIIIMPVKVGACDF